MLSEAIGQLGIKALKDLLKESDMTPNHVCLVEGIGPIATVNDDDSDCGFKTFGIKSSPLSGFKLIEINY